MAFYKATWAEEGENAPTLYPENALVNLDSWVFHLAQYDGASKQWTVAEETAVFDAEEEVVLTAVTKIEEGQCYVSTEKAKAPAMPHHVAGFQVPQKFWPLMVGKKVVVDWYQPSEKVKRKKLAFAGTRILGYASNKTFPKSKSSDGIYVIVGVTQLLDWKNPFDLDSTETVGVNGRDGKPYMVIELKDTPLSFDYSVCETEEEFLEFFSEKNVQQTAVNNAEDAFGS